MLQHGMFRSAAIAIPSAECDNDTRRKSNFQRAAPPHATPTSTR